MRGLIAAGLACAAASVSAQPLPSPRFTAPPAADNSNAGATTGWVRSQQFLSATGDLSGGTVLSNGSLVARTQAARAADVFNILDYGAVADGSTDIGPALRAIAAKLGAGASSNVIAFPTGCYRLASAVVFAGVAPILQGQGYSQGPGCNGTGTWIKVDRTGFTPFTFNGVNARGAKVRDMGFYQLHPNSAPGWVPTAYDYIFRIQDTLGEVSFDNVIFSGVNKGIYADNSGRLNIKDVQGQFYTTGIEIDDCYDIARVQRLHVWPFLTSDPNIVTYQEANADALLLRRVDGIYAGHVFVLGMRSAVHMSSGVNGVLSKGYIDDLYGDFVKYGVWIDGSGSSVQLTNVTTQHNDLASPGAALAGGKGLYVNASGVLVQVANWRTTLVETNAIDVEGAGNRVDLGNLRVEAWNLNSSGAPAVFVADSGGGTANALTISGQPSLSGGNGALLDNGATNAVKTRTVLMNLPGATVDEPRFYAAPTGGQVASAAIGPDPSIDYVIGAKGPTGSVRLQASGQSVLRVDNPNNLGSDLLVRSLMTGVALIVESGTANADALVNGKGTGGVQLQSSGKTVLRTDNLNAGTSDLLIRPGAGNVTLAAEDPGANADVILTSKGAGTIQVVANGSAVLRADNPNAGSTDLLVRRTTGAVALIAEDAATNADILLGAKGASSIRLQTGGTTDMRVTGSGDTDALVTSNVGNVTISPENGTNAGDLVLAGLGAVNGVRLLANSGTVLRVDNPNSGDSNLLVRTGPGLVAMSAESGGANANLALFAKGAGSVTAPTAATSDSSTQVATTAFVKAQGYLSSAGLGPLATQAALVSAPLLGTAANGSLVPVTLGGGLSLSGGSLSAAGGGAIPAATSSVRGGITVGQGLTVSGDQLGVAFGSVAGTAVQGNDPRVVGAAPTASPTLTGIATVAGFNSLTMSGSATGAPLRLLPVGGDSNVDLWADALGSQGSVRLRANGVAVLRVDSPGPGTSDLLARSGAGTIALTAEDPGASASIALAPKGTGAVVVSGSADNLAMAGSSTGAAPTLATTGTDAAVPIVLAPKGGGALTVAAAGSATVLKGASLTLQGAGTTPTELGSSGVGGSPVVLLGAEAGQASTIVSSGASYATPINVSRVILGTGATSTFTLTLPTAPVDGQLLLIECDQAITLTVQSSGGFALKGAPTACSTTQGHQFHFRAGDGAWRMDF